MSVATAIEPVITDSKAGFELLAKQLVEGTRLGLHRSPFQGSSSEFSEYTAYTPGEDTRFLDWKILARTDRAYVQKFDDETNLFTHFVVDQGHSMFFSSDSSDTAPQLPTKFHYAATTAATIGWLLLRQQDGFSLSLVDEKLRNHIPESASSSQLSRVCARLDAIAGRVHEQISAAKPQETSDSLPSALPFFSSLTELTPIIGRRRLVVLLSDFLPKVTLTEEERARVFLNTQHAVATLQKAGNQVIALQVLDPAERRLETLKKANFLRSLATRQEFFVDSNSQAESYREAFLEYQNDLQALFSDLGVKHIMLKTEASLMTQIHPLFG